MHVSPPQTGLHAPHHPGQPCRYPHTTQTQTPTLALAHTHYLSAPGERPLLKLSCLLKQCNYQICQASQHNKYDNCDEQKPVCAGAVTPRSVYTYAYLIVDQALARLQLGGCLFCVNWGSRLTCCWFRADMYPRVITPQQVLDEGGFARAVLSQQKHRGLGLKV